MAKWLIKSEPSECSIDHVKQEKVTLWDGVRNYQARNNLRAMKKGELVLYYHSVEEPIGIVGVVKVAREAYPDPTQFDSNSEYYDSKASLKDPRWWCPDFQFVEKFDAILPLSKLREEKALQKMTLLQRGSRLSVQPVTDSEYQTIMGMVRKV